MAEIKQDLKLQSDPSTIVRPNIVGDNIPSDAVTTAKILDGAVTTDKLAAGAVTNNKLAQNSVDRDNIVDDAIETTHIVDDAITTQKIVNGAITNPKIATGTIENGKIKNNEIRREKLKVYNGTMLTDYVESEQVKQEITEFAAMIAEFIRYGYRLYFESSDEVANVSIYVDVNGEVRFTLDANVSTIPSSSLVQSDVVTIDSDADVQLFFSSYLSNYFLVSGIYSANVTF